MKEKRTSCPDCDTEMQPIKLIDEIDGRAQRVAKYAAGDAAHSFFFCRFSEAGEVGAQMCPECGRIILHAVPQS